jgi:hypothetical protein
MRRNTLIAILFAAAALAAAPAMAAEGGASTTLDQSVPIATVALPVVIDGQIVNYVFVSVKVLLTASADSIALRDKEPYFRDALVRAGHRAPFVRAGDYNHLDDDKLKAAMYREAVAIAGPGQDRRRRGGYRDP